MDSSPLEASKIFSRVQKYMFKVSRRCSWIRAFKRTNSHVHRTHTSAWKLGKTCFLRIFQKFISKFRNLIWDFLIFQWILRLQRPLKNFLELKSICLRYLEGAPGSGLSNAPTPMAIRHIDQKILQIFDFCGKKPTLRYLFESHFSNSKHFSSSIFPVTRESLKILSSAI